MSNHPVPPALPPALPPQFPCRTPAVALPPAIPPAVPLTPNPCPLIPAVLLALILLLTACGRRPGQPTPLPLGTRVDQPTPDFSAPAQAETSPQSADQVAQSLRPRLAQQQTQTAPTPASTLTPAVSPAVPPAVPPAVFSRPTALGILSGGGLLYAAPAGPIAANLRVGATLTITGRSADRVWFAAYLGDGTAGWVPAAQVRVFGDANQLETVQESLGPALVATLIAEASKPQVPISTVVVRLTATTAATGDASPQTTPAPPAAAPEITGPAITIIVEGANLRTGPGTDFPVVGGLYQDDKAPLLGRNQNGDWLQVQLPETTAWIFAPLVQTTLPIADLPTIEPPPNN